jgi:hypothetical protein
MKMLYTAAIVAVTFCAVAAVGKPAVALRINYEGKQMCSYRIEYTSQGEYKQKGTITKKKTGVNCVSSAVITGENKVTITMDTVSIKSDLYKEEKIKEMHESIMKSTYSLRLTDGYPAIDTSAGLPVSDYLSWDIYRQLIKLLPVLPEESIKPGYTWEQTITVPMKTARGTIPCEMYRFYTFKKLKGDTATISWNFRYAPADNAVDSTNPLEEVPIGGKGSGQALISVRHKCLLSADMGFSTPVAVIDDISVMWRERAVFKLKSCK